MLSLSVLAGSKSTLSISPKEVVLTSWHWWSGVITLSQFQQFRLTDGGRVAMQLVLARPSSPASLAAIRVPLFTVSILPGIGTSGELAFTVSVFLAVNTFAALAAVTGDAVLGGDGGTGGLGAAW